MTFVSGDDVDFVAFDRALDCRVGLEVYDATAQESGRLMHIVLVEIEVLCDLLVREISAIIPCARSTCARDDGGARRSYWADRQSRYHKPCSDSVAVQAGVDATRVA
jgi:hypothetical protein